MTKFSATDLAGGLLVAGIGAVFAIVALRYPLGAINNPGPGVFPMAVGLMTFFIGLGIVVRGFVLAAERPISITHRSVVAVSAAVGAFALLIRPVGLIPTLFVVVLIAALGSSKSRLVPTLGVAAGTAIGSWLIFVAGLGLPIAPVRMPF